MVRLVIISGLQVILQVLPHRQKVGISISFSLLQSRHSEEHVMSFIAFV